VALVLAVPVLAGERQPITAQQLASHGVPPGPAREVLPATGALLHVQVSDPLSALEGIEDILVSGMPQKALPPEMQDLFSTEHPLLTVLGLEAVQEPLSPEVIERKTGLDSRGSISLTAYLGDPRRAFVLGLPAPGREPLAQWLSMLLEPEEVEEISLGEKRALRVVSPKLKWLPELFVVTSDSTVYLCGDRSLAIALHNSPAAQRFGQDTFMSRVLPAQDKQQVRLIVNPTSVKPLAMQLQSMRGLVGMIIQQQRGKLLQNLPAEAREQFEMQVRTQFGVKDLDQFADYAECVIVATLEQLIDFITGGMVSFEGLAVSADLNDGVESLSLRVFSQKFQAEKSATPLPLDEVKRALAWLGPEIQYFSAVGQKPAPRDLPVLANWAERVRQQLEKKGLPSVALDRLEKMLQDRSPVPTVESQVPWTLTAHAPLRPLPSLDKAESIQDYFVDLELPVHRPVKLVPGKDVAFLQRTFQAEADGLNRNRQLGFEFANSFQKQKPWVDQLNRFQSAQLQGGVAQLTRESAWITRGGIFGYDQHELVNRKVVWARQVGPYLVYHRGAKGSDWLRELAPSPRREIVPGVSRLLDQVPECANYVAVHRVLVGLPGFTEWLETLESRAHADVDAYLNKAQSLLDASADLEAAKQKIRGLKMPGLVGSLAVDPQNNKVYALLPTGGAAFPLPRPRLIPVIQELLADYAAKADEVGGCLVTTRVKDEAWECSVSQRWDAVTTLTRTFGNTLAERYLSTQAGQQALAGKLGAPRDWDSGVFDEVIARNPQWAFIQQPQPKTDAEPGKPIPPRDPAADPGMVDLTAYYNGALDDTWQAGGLANNHLGDLPRGLQEFGSVRFDVRGVVQLSGNLAEQQLGVRFPRTVEGIRVARQGERLHFLHACGWPATQGAQVGTYVVHYANGQQQQVPINYGKDVLDWWLNQGTDGTSVNVVWRGRNNASPDGPQIGVFKTTWINPRPEQEIATIDYRSSMTDAAPFLIAITVE
jgi:hypothetical protein